METEIVLCDECQVEEGAPATNGEDLCDACAEKAGLAWCESCESYTDEWGSSDELCQDCQQSAADYDSDMER